MKEGKRICDKCGGEGTLPEEPLEPVLAVRIKGGGVCDWYGDHLGRIFVVKNDPISGYYRFGGSLINPSHVEVIPPYDKTKFRLRRKWGKDEEMTEYGDKRWDGEFWVMSPRDGFTQGTYIYIAPIKPATPDPSADCLPGFVAFPVEITPAGKYLEAYVPHVTCLEELPGDVRWSGRYGYKQMTKVIWVTCPRMYGDDYGNLSGAWVRKHKTPTMPDYVEMKESE